MSGGSQLIPHLGLVTHVIISALARKFTLLPTRPRIALIVNIFLETPYHPPPPHYPRSLSLMLKLSLIHVYNENIMLAGICGLSNDYPH